VSGRPLGHDGHLGDRVLGDGAQPLVRGGAHGRLWLFSDAVFGGVKKLKPEELSGDDADALGFFQAMLNLRAALPVHDQAFHDAVRRLDTSRRDRDRWLTVVTRHDADGVRIVRQDPLDAATYLIPACCTAAPPEAPLSRAQVPLASVGFPSGWASTVAQRTGGSGSSPLGGLPLPIHQLVPPLRASLFASLVNLATTAPSSRADPVTPVVSTVARVATANRLPLAPPVPYSLLSDTSATLGSEGEVCLERLVGSLCGPSAGFPTSVLLVSMVDLLGILSNDFFTWAETHPMGDLDALEAVLQGWSRSGVSGQLWRLLNIYQQRQESHLGPVEKAGTWRARGSGTGDRRDDAAGADETWYRDAPGSPQRGTGGGSKQNWGSSYCESRPRPSTPGENTCGYGRTYGGQDGPSGYEGPSATRSRLDLGEVSVFSAGILRWRERALRWPGSLPAPLRGMNHETYFLYKRGLAVSWLSYHASWASRPGSVLSGSWGRSPLRRQYRYTAATGRRPECFQVSSSGPYPDQRTSKQRTPSSSQVCSTNRSNINSDPPGWTASATATWGCLGLFAGSTGPAGTTWSLLTR